MKRLSPEERRYILHQTLVRIQKDWVCRYGQWNTAKLLRELRRLLRKAGQASGPETPGAAATDEEVPLFDEPSA